MPHVVTVQHTFNQPPERVFEAWVKPEIARHFFFASETGMVVECHIDARPGGHFTVVDRRPNDGAGMMDVKHTGTFLTVQRPHRLVFSFSVPKFSPASTQVSVDITATPEGCRLALTHDLGDGPDAAAMAERTRQGWNKVLQNAERALRK